MDLFRKIISGHQIDPQISGSETVEKLTDRLKSSTLLEDRRDAVRALKSLSKKYKEEIAMKSIQPLIDVLEQDRSDLEIVRLSLETLTNVISNQNEEEEEEMAGIDQKDADDFPERISQIIINNNNNNIPNILSLFQELDYHILLPAIHLTTILLRLATKQMQDIILSNPLTVSRFMDLLGDQREIIRNENLLLLIELTKNNSNIQKIIVFEGCFDKLLDVVKQEGLSDGGVVVEDCLLLLLNLLKNNLSNQNFFKEGSYINKLIIFFSFDNSDDDNLFININWGIPKINNVKSMLKIIRILVSPSNPLQQTTSCQKIIYQCGLMNKLCKLMMSDGVPNEVLIDCITTVAEVIRGNHSNQNHFASIMAPSTPPRSAIVILLMSMLVENQSLKIKLSILYFFQSFLSKNQSGQNYIIQTLLPSASEVNQLTAGQLLCAGLFSNDILSPWLSAVCLSHSIYNNSQQKEQLLRVQLASSLGNPPVSLIQQCANLLTMGSKFQTKVALLQLLSNWMFESEISVNHFLLNQQNVPFLISQISQTECDEEDRVLQGLSSFLLSILILFNNNNVLNFHRKDLKQIIEKRIGIEHFLEKLSQISKHELYIKSSKYPLLSVENSSHVLFDYEFTQLFRKLEGEIIKIITLENIDEENKKKNNNNNDDVINQYKLIIRQQDENLKQIKDELNEKINENNNLKNIALQNENEIKILKDKIQVLNFKFENSEDMKNDNDKKENNNDKDDNKKIEELELIIKEKEIKINEIKNNNNNLNQQLSNMSLNKINEENKTNSELTQERVDLNNKIGDLEKKISDLIKENESLLYENNDFKSKLKCLNSEKIFFQEEIKKINLKNEELNNENKKLESDKAETEVEKDGVMEEMENIKKEQDDLLLLLSEQQNKLKLYRNQLRKLGLNIEDELEEDEEDEEEEEEDEKKNENNKEDSV